MNKKAEIMKELEQTFPSLEFLLFSTKQHDNKELIGIIGFSGRGNSVYWSIEVVSPLAKRMHEILQKHEYDNFRLMFIRGNQFVLYSPDTGCGNVFREYDKPIQIDVYNFIKEQQYYIGACHNIVDVVDYLKHTTICF